MNITTWNSEHTDI